MMKMSLLALAGTVTLSASALADPIYLRCANVSISRPNPNAYYALLTVDLVPKTISMATHYPEGGNTMD